jgi:hypothetical protein
MSILYQIIPLLALGPVSMLTFGERLIRKDKVKTVTADALQR